MKTALMFAVVLFGAYSQYEAKETIQNYGVNKIQMSQSAKDNISDDDKFMKRALELSQRGIKYNDGDPFGAIVVKDGKIIGEGWNKTRIQRDPSAHAEVEAIRDACKSLDATDLHDCTIYTSAQPCPMCLSLIYMTNIKKVYYCIPHPKITSFNKDLSVDHVYKELTMPEIERKTREVQLLPEEVDKYLDSYRSQ